MNNNGADQTVWMRRLVRIFVTSDGKMLTGGLPNEKQATIVSHNVSPYLKLNLVTLKSLGQEALFRIISSSNCREVDIKI